MWLSTVRGDGHLEVRVVEKDPPLGFPGAPPWLHTNTLRDYFQRFGTPVLIALECPLCDFLSVPVRACTCWGATDAHLLSPMCAWTTGEVEEVRLGRSDIAFVRFRFPNSQKRCSLTLNPQL